MRRFFVVLVSALVLASALTIAGSPVGAQAGDTPPGAPPRPAPAGAHWTYVAAGDRAEGRQEVVGGTPATPGTFPYQVALVDTRVPGLNIRGQFCGGSLISPDTVLTASHCIIAGVWVLVDDNDNVLDVFVQKIRPADVDVLAGDVNLGTGSTAERLHVRRIRLSPDFTIDLDAGFNFFVPDVAVLQLASSSTTGTAVDLAVPGQEDLYPAGTAATVSGWGNTGNALEAPPTVLQQASLPIVSDADCTTAYGTDFDATRNLCAGDLVDGLPTPCFGDSGGPLVVDNGGSPLQVGIVLGGDGCPAAERPALFSRVSANVAWVGRYLDPDEVPDPPGRARARQYGDRAVVSWRAPEFDGGTPVTGYQVKVAQQPVVTVPAAAREVEVDALGLVSGRRYRVTVRAVNAVGTSAPRVTTFRCFMDSPGVQCGANI